MSFNGSGTFVPPAGQPVVPGTVIQSGVFNTLVQDIGNTLNNVLPRDGQAAMSGQLKVVDGTSSIPGLSFNSEASSGLYRPSAGMIGLVASGVEVMRVNSSGRLLIGSTTDDGTNKLQVTGATKITGALTVTGAITGNLTGNVTGSASSIAGIVPVASGGTGVATLTGLAYGNGTGAFSAATAAQLVTALGYVPYNVTNPSGYQNAAQLSAVAANYMPLTGGTLSGNITFANNTGLFFKDTGGTSHQTFIYSGDNNIYMNMPVGGYYRIQNVASTATIYTLDNGGTQTLAGNLVSSGVQCNGNLNVTGQSNIYGVVYAQSSSNLKIALYTGGTVNGYIAADASYCFRTINASNGLYTLNVDNSGNVTAPGTINGNSVTANGTVQGGYINSTGNVNAQGAFTTNGNISSNAATGAGGIINNFNQLYMNGSNASNPSIGFNNINVGSKTIRLGSGGSLEYVNSGYTSVISYLTDGGNFYAVTLTASSDERKKENWSAVEPTFITDLASIEKVGMFDWVDGSGSSLGVGAQSLQKFLPAAIHTGEDGSLSVNYGSAAMVSAVELAKEVVNLKAEVQALKDLVNQLVGAK